MSPHLQYGFNCILLRKIDAILKTWKTLHCIIDQVQNSWIRTPPRKTTHVDSSLSGLGHLQLPQTSSSLKPSQSVLKANPFQPSLTQRCLSSEPTKTDRSNTSGRTVSFSLVTNSVALVSKRKSAISVVTCPQKLHCTLALKRDHRIHTRRGWHLNAPDRFGVLKFANQAIL